MADMRSPDELYVGYLAVPRGIRVFLRILVPGVLWSLVVVALVMGRSQPDPGAATWEQGKARTFSGTLSAHPYPILFSADRGDGEPAALLVVESGKRGAAARAAPLDGQQVTATGWLLHRDGRTILELDPAAEALVITSAARVPLPAAVPLGRVTLRGEIVDSKCFLGAMKPGDGKTHKECATLCISGGIPPMLIVRETEPRHCLLIDTSGGPLSRDVYPFIADPVEVSGELAAIGGVLQLRIAPQDVKPWR